jgi:AcrR family transcriptional regulator
VLADQRARLLAAVPGVVAEHGYEATSVADIVKRAAVSRNAFYNNFGDKQECFAIAHEAGHERLLEILSQPCEAGGTLEERVERSLTAALEALSSDPDMARMLFVEAPSSAGEEIALRYHEWLERYGALLRSLAPASAATAGPLGEMDQVIVGGIASRIASEVLKDGAAELTALKAPLAEYVLTFYGPSQPDHQSGKVVALDPEPASEYAEAQRRRAGA